MSLRLVLMASLLLAPTGAAQEGTPSPAEVQESLRALEDHDRGELHPAEDPLLVVGREQGDNDLRSRTPGLARGVQVAAQVDPEELYARALALHEGRVFHSAPRSPAELEKAGKPDARRPREDGAPVLGEDEAGGSVSWVVGGLAAAAVAVLLGRRFMR